MDRRAAGALLALAACFACSAAAPTASNQTALDLYEGAPEGCYYNFQHYGEGDRIMTNEPCLNCTCHNRMLMCYLRVCPFTKAIGQDCTVEKRADQCCPIVTCPDVPVDLLTSTSTTSPAEYGATGLGKLDKYGCSISGKYFPEGSKVPPTPNKPCEHCYCIRNMTTCVMQECTLHVDGCTPIYHKDVCCPVRYSCDHPEDEVPLLDDMSTTVRPTPGFLLTTTTISPVTQMTQDCVHDDRVFSDGALIKTEKACEHCYCMKGDIVCVVQECGAPMENEGKNCTSLPPREGQCCPDTYICEGDELISDLPTESTTESIIEKLTTLVPPRRTSVEGSGYRNEPDEAPYTDMPIIEPEVEGSGDEEETSKPLGPNEIIPTPGDDDQYIYITTKGPAYEEHEKTTEAIDRDIIPDVKDKTVEPQFSTIAPASDVEEKLTTSVEKDILEPHDHELTTKAPEIKESATTELGDSQNTVPDVIPDEEVAKPNEFASTTTVAPSSESESLTPTKGDDDKLTSAQDGQDVIMSTTSKLGYSTTTSSTLDEIEKETASPADVSNVTPEAVTEKEYTDGDITRTTSATSVEEIPGEQDKETSKPEVLAPSTTISPTEGDKESTKPEALAPGTTSSPAGEEKESSEPDQLAPITTSSPPNEGENLTTEPDHAQNTVAVSEDDSTHPHSHIPSVTVSPTDDKESTTVFNQEQDITEKVIKEDIPATIDGVTTAASADKVTEFTTAEPDRGLNTIPSEIYEESSSEPSLPRQTTLSEETKGTEPSVITDEMKTHGVEVPSTTAYELTTPQPEIIVTKGDQVTVTTEPSFRKEDEGIVSTEKTKEIEPTTVKSEFVDEGLIPTSPHEDKTGASAGVPTAEEEFTTSIPEYITEITETIGSKQTTTEANKETSVVTEISPEKVSEPSSEQDSDLPSSTEKLNEITPLIDTHEEPSRIPGEGDCLLNGVTYRNNTVVPSTNNCHTGCRCASSIIKCDPIICSPPPDYMENCQSIYDSPDSCCPTFVCDHPRETAPPQSDNQMSGTESPMPSPTIECRGDQCEISEPTKQPLGPSEPCTSGNCVTADEHKIETECGSDGCGDLPQKPDTSIPSLEHTEECSGGKCKPESCANGECEVPQTQVSPVTPCEGKHCEKTDEVLPELPQQCKNGEDCKTIEIPTGEPIPCEGDSCNKIDCGVGGCGSDVIASQPDHQLESCKEEDGCKPQDIPAPECTGDGPCRRKETSTSDAKPPATCDGPNCVSEKEATVAQGVIDLSTELPKTEQTPSEGATEKTLTGEEEKATEPADHTTKPDEEKISVQDTQGLDSYTTEGHTAEGDTSTDIHKEQPITEDEGTKDVEKETEMPVITGEKDSEKPIPEEETTLKPTMIEKGTETPDVIEEETTKPAMLGEEGVEKPTVEKDKDTEKPIIIDEKATEEPTLVGDEGKEKPDVSEKESTEEPIIDSEESTKKPAVHDKEKPVIDEESTNEPTTTDEHDKEKPTIDEESTKQPATVDEGDKEKPAIDEESTKQPASVDEGDKEKPTIDEESTKQPASVDEGDKEKPVVDEESTKKPDTVEEGNKEKPMIDEESTKQPATVDESDKEKPTIDEESTKQPATVNEDDKEKPTIDEDSTKQPATVDEGEKEKPTIDEDSTKQPATVDEDDKEKSTTDKDSTKLPVTVDKGVKEKPTMDEESTKQPATVDEDDKDKEKPTIDEENTKQPDTVDEDFKDKENPTIDEESTKQPATVDEDDKDKEKPTIDEESTKQPATVDEDEKDKEKPTIDEESTRQPATVDEDDKDKEKPTIDEESTKQPATVDEDDKDKEKPTIDEESTKQPAIADEDDKDKEKATIDEESTKQPAIVDEDDKDKEKPTIDEESTKQPATVDEDDKGKEKPTIDEESTKQPATVDEDDKNKEKPTIDEESTKQPATVDDGDTEKPVFDEEGTKKPDTVEVEGTTRSVITEEFTTVSSIGEKTTEAPAIIDQVSTDLPAVADIVTEKPSLIDEGEKDKPLVTEKDKTDKPTITEDDTEKPITVDEEGKPTDVGVKDTDKPGQEPITEIESKKPDLTEKEGTDKPFTEEGTTENPNVINEETTAKAVVIDEDGKEKLGHGEDEVTDKPIDTDENGTETPIAEDGDKKPALFGQGDTETSEGTTAEPDLVDKDKSSEKPDIDQDTEEPTVVERRTEKPALIDTDEKEIPAVVETESTKKPTDIEKDTTELLVNVGEETTKKPVVTIDEEGIKKPDTEEETMKPFIIDEESTAVPDITEVEGTAKPVIIDEGTEEPTIIEKEEPMKPSVIEREGTELPVINGEESTEKPSVSDEETKEKHDLAEQEGTKKPGIVEEGTEAPVVPEDGTEEPSMFDRESTEKPTLIDEDGKVKPIAEDDSKKPIVDEDEGQEKPIMDKDADKPLIIDEEVTDKPTEHKVVSTEGLNVHEEGSGTEIPEKSHTTESEKEVKSPELTAEPTEATMTETDKTSKTPYSESQTTVSQDVVTSPQETTETKVTEAEDSYTKEPVVDDHSRTPEIATDSHSEQEITTKTPVPDHEKVTVSEHDVEGTTLKVGTTDVKEEGSTDGHDLISEEPELITKAPELHETSESVEPTTEKGLISEQEEVSTDTSEIEYPTTKAPGADSVKIEPQEGIEPDKPDLHDTSKLEEESTTKIYAEDKNKPISESHGTDDSSTSPESDGVTDIPEITDDKPKPESPKPQTDHPDIHSSEKQEIITETPEYSVTEPVRRFTEIEDPSVTGQEDTATGYSEAPTDHHLPSVTEKIDETGDVSITSSEKPMLTDMESELPEKSTESDKPVTKMPDYQTPEDGKDKTTDKFESPATGIPISDVTEPQHTSDVTEKDVTSYDEKATTVSDLSDDKKIGTTSPTGYTEKPEPGMETTHHHVTTTEDVNKATGPYVIEPQVTESQETSTKSVEQEKEGEAETTTPEKLYTESYDVDKKETSVTEIPKVSTDLPIEDIQTERPAVQVSSEVPQSLVTEQKESIGEQTTVSSIPKEESSYKPELPTTQSEEIPKAPEKHDQEEIPTEAPVHVTAPVEISTKETVQDDKITHVSEDVTEKQYTAITLQEPTAVTEEAEHNEIMKSTEHTSAQTEVSETTPYLIELEEHTHKIAKDPTTESPSEEEHSYRPVEDASTSSPPEEELSQKPVEDISTPYPSEEEHSYKPIDDMSTSSPTKEEDLHKPVKDLSTSAPSEEEHSQKPVEEISTSSPSAEEHTPKTEEHISTVSPLDEKLTTVEQEAGEEPQVSELTTKKADEEIETSTKEAGGITKPSEVSLPEDVSEKISESIPFDETTATVIHSEDDKDISDHKEYTTAVPSQITEESTPIVATESEKLPTSESDIAVPTEKEVSTSEKPSHPIVSQETTVPEDEFIFSTTKATTIRQGEDIATPVPDMLAKPEEKPSETSEVPPSSTTTEVSKPSIPDLQPTDEIPVPDDDGHFAPSGTSGYGEPDYVEEDQAFGPGTCRYGGKVYVSAQQIPRDDPCDFCFCFRSDIICLQQSCPPPIHGCHEEPIQGFCCPRYECPVSMATTVNVTTTTTTTTTTLPPHFPTHSYKGQAQRRGCQIKGHTYKVGEVVRSSSGPCLHCTCGGDGQMKCDPKACTPEPMLRQMIAAAVSAKRRR